MASAMDNLNWIDEITVSKTKYDKMSEEEQLNLFPTGVLKHDTEAAEFCDMYAELQRRYQNNEKFTQDDFKKKI